MTLQQLDDLLNQLLMHAGASDTHIPRPLLKRAVDAIAAMRSDAKDAARYRWLRSEPIATAPRYYDFWQELNAKLCREEKMDALIDSAMKESEK